MNIRYIILSLLTAVCMASCSNDEDSENSESFVTINIPIEISATQPQVTTRATGDPGYDDGLSAPKYLYLWVWVKKSGETTYTLIHMSSSSPTWTYSGTEDTDSKWTYNYAASLSFTGDGEGRVYAVASNKEITLTTTDFTTFTSQVISCSGWSQENLRDLYSTPTNDTDDGVITFTSGKASCAPVRLYHAAAKVDFTWEVAESLRPGTSINSITLTNLPTSCKIFEPTANTNAGGTCLLLGTSGASGVVNAVTTANKWTGREYAYVLQPASGKLTYDVDLEGKDDVSNKTFTPSSFSKVYTGWYRVMANIN